MQDGPAVGGEEIIAQGAASEKCTRCNLFSLDGADGTESGTIP